MCSEVALHHSVRMETPDDKSEVVEVLSMALAMSENRRTDIPQLYALFPEFLIMFPIAGVVSSPHHIID